MRTCWIVFQLLLACGIASPAAAQDKALAKLHAVLEPLRVGVAKDMRGATPALMDVKHGLRDWIEARLPGLPADGDEHVFAARLNQDLQQADLFCVAPTAPAINRCATRDPLQWNMTGFLGPIRLERHDGNVLFVVTQIGLDCGDDDSAYGYERRESWRPIWAYEQPIAVGTAYQPQHITGIRIAFSHQQTQGLVLLLGQATACTSNWHPVYYRLWRLGPEKTAAKLLVDESRVAFFAHESAIEGSVTPGEAVVEFTAGSLDSDFHSYEAVRRYEVQGDKVMRAGPVALGPRGFTEEWLRGEWSEVSAWTAPGAHDALQASYTQLHPVYAKSGEYVGDHTQRCRKSPELWQVGIGFGADDTPKRNAFFLVRWQPPYRFQMVAIRGTPRADCDQPDAAADADRTLFQDWR